VLKNKQATTHHLFYDEFHAAFPDVLLVKNKRFVQSSPVIFTAGGLSSGIDLALHIVQLYFGAAQAEETASLMEYEGMGWKRDGTVMKSQNPVLPQPLHPGEHIYSMTTEKVSVREGLAIAKVPRVVIVGGGFGGLY